MQNALWCLTLLLLIRAAAPLREPGRQWRTSDQHVAPGSLRSTNAATLSDRRGSRLHAGASPGAALAADLSVNTTTSPMLEDPILGSDGELSQEEVEDTLDEVKVEAGDVQEAILEGDVSIWNGVKKRLRECIDDFKKLPSGMRNMFESNMQILDTLMPGIKARTSSIFTLPIIVTTGAFWGTVYFCLFYKSDFDENPFVDNPTTPRDGGPTPSPPLEGGASTTSSSVRRLDTLHWNDAARAKQFEASQESATKVQSHADVIFVFPHPSYEEQHDRGKLVTRDMLRRAMAERKDRGFFHEIETVARDHDVTKTQAIGGRRLSRLKSTLGDVENITMGELRILLLKDMCRSLPKMGFSVHLFSSVDSEDLFLCVSLNRPEVVQHYLLRENVELQTTLEVVERLDILQDPLDPRSSPPFLRYDQKLVKSLYKAEVIDEADERALYRIYHDRGAEGSVMSSAERIHIIEREITRFLNLEACKEVGIITDWYPCHSELWLNKLKETWSHLTVMTDMSFMQPIPLLGEYYGSQLAFSFAWQGVWCKGLVCLSVAAILITVLKFVEVDRTVELIRLLIPVDVAERPGHHTLVPEKQLMPFAILVLAWARVMTNLWRRDQEYFQTLWNQHVVLNTCDVIRPSFKGIFEKSDVDGRIEEENAPLNEKIAMRVLSVCITLVCCLAVMLVSGTWVHIHHGNLDLVASVWLSVIVKISELLFNTLSARLVEMENHKYDQDYHDSWVWHQFLFQAVNNFWPCICVPVSQIVSGHCPEAGCFLTLQRQVGLLVGVLLACSISFNVLEAVQVWLMLKWEDRRIRIHSQKGKDVEVKQRSFLEEQAKYAPFNMRAQIENMLQLVIGLGFVMLFGTLQPMVVPMCLVHFKCALRFRAVLLTWRFTKRPLPHKLDGVGAWSGVMDMLVNFGVFFSGVLVVLWGRFFHHALLLAKITGLVLWFVLIFGIWALVDVVVPAKSPEAHVMTRRRAYASRVITEVAMSTKEQRRSQREVQTRDAANAASDDDSHLSSSGLDSDGDGEESQSTSGQGNQPLRRRISMLDLTDAITKRRMALELACDVEDLIPQGQLVQDEAWDCITHLDGKDAEVPTRFQP